MPLIDISCDNGHESEVYRHHSDWPKTPACPACGAPTVQLAKAPGYVSGTAAPVVVYRDPRDGSYRYPGATDSPQTRAYDRAGLERVELRGFADVRRFEKQATAQENAIAARKAEVAQAAREAREKGMRADLRMSMQSMSPLGRDVARAAMARNDGKPRPRETVGDAGLHIEAYSNTRSNRPESRDAQGRRRPD